ncbi:hypothetical protein ACFYQ5_26930 [Streptomyces sp. NPDC005794]|uniref:hypothetical protein n=1 Tax=Streptomyces sp. NPDC005794 TaxID=3364733 RepID=UPI0036A205C3
MSAVPAPRRHERVPVRGGPASSGLDQAAYLEATTAFLIGLWHSGHDPRTLLPPFEVATA